MWGAGNAYCGFGRRVDLPDQRAARQQVVETPIASICLGLGQRMGRTRNIPSFMYHQKSGIVPFPEVDCSACIRDANWIATGCEVAHVHQGGQSNIAYE
jgi:hypothetical protein